MFLDDDPFFNAFAAPLIQQYGYGEGGVQQGGGEVGVDPTYDTTDLTREDFSAGFDYFLSRHQLSLAIRATRSVRSCCGVSNGWGEITAVGWSGRNERRHAGLL